MFTATAKPTSGTHRPLNHLGLAHYFSAIRGGDPGVEKHDLLFNAKAEYPEARVLMVGDRSFDMIAAKTAGCLAVGALWGYGAAVELMDAGADVLIENPSRMVAFVESLFSKGSVCQV